MYDNADDINMWITKPASKSESKLLSGSRSNSVSDLGVNQKYDHLIDYLPRSSQGCIIFTTRDMKAAVKLAHQNVVEVPEMNKAVAKQLLQNLLIKVTQNSSDVETLLAQLTYLPLAIVQAAAYINENRISVSDYISLLTDQEEEIIDLLSEEFEDDWRYRNLKNPVATTWLISFEQIRHRDPLAADYLSFMACIDPKTIPLSLLPAGKSRKKETDAIGTLNAYSFLTMRPTDLALDLHRLVHLATRNWLRKEKLIVEWTKRAISRLEEVFPDDDHKYRSIWRSYIPHARYVLLSDLVDSAHINSNLISPNHIDKINEIRMDLILKFGNCLLKDGRYKEATVLLTEVTEARKKALGVEHPSTLIAMVNLAWSHRAEGQWK